MNNENILETDKQTNLFIEELLNEYKNNLLEFVDSTECIFLNNKIINEDLFNNIDTSNINKKEIDNLYNKSNKLISIKNKKSKEFLGKDVYNTLNNLFIKFKFNISNDVKKFNIKDKNSIKNFFIKLKENITEFFNSLNTIKNIFIKKDSKYLKAFSIFFCMYIAEVLIQIIIPLIFSNLILKINFGLLNKLIDIIISGILCPIIEEIAKEVSIKLNVSKEFFIISNEFEFTNYVFIMKLDGFDLLTAVKIRSGSLLMHFVNTKILELFDKLGIKSDNKFFKVFINIISVIFTSLIHIVWNVSAIFNDNIFVNALKGS